MTAIRLLIYLSLLWRSVSSLQQQQLVIYGLGNVGRAVAEEAPNDWIVKGTTREEPVDKISIPFDEASGYLADATHVLITIPPTTTPDVSASILSDLKSASSAWIGFVSTSGVYGNHDGAWVQEDSELLSSSSALKYVDFEQEVLDFESSACIFRCAGLYGPTRSALHTLWKRGGKPSSTSTTTAFITNRIHERDVARAIVSAMRQDCSGIYNLSDDKPETREVVMEYAARLLDTMMTVPEGNQILPGKKTKRGERRKKERKLVDNSKMKADLVDQLLYPTYREGLDFIVADKSNAWWN